MLCVAANPTGPHAGDCQQRGREGEGDESAGPWRCQRAPHVRLTCASRALRVVGGLVGPKLHSKIHS